MSLSASSGLILANHKSGLKPQMSQAAKAQNLNNIDNKKKQENQKINPFSTAQEETTSQVAFESDSIPSIPTETLGTMAYSSSGAESAGTMASAAGSVGASVSCVA